jgi:C4-dicarboxylate-specific signal transduction histidine kinase
VFRRKDGSTFPVEFTATPIFEFNCRVGSVIVFRDMTERLGLQAQIVQSSKLATLGEMATGIAHELNQPLNIIRLAVENLRRKVGDEAAQPAPASVEHKLGRIVAQVDRAATIIDRMRVFGRRAREDATDVDVRRAVENAAGMIDSQLRDKDIEIEITGPGSGPLVRGHPVELEQVILNLLSNARDAIAGQSRRDGGRIVIAIETTNDPAGGPARALIRVADTGGGVPEALLDRLFEPFFTTKPPGQETGLGLSVSYGIIANMGGTIEARNRGRGAEFVISLPIAGGLPPAKPRPRAVRADGVLVSSPADGSHRPA